jgi:hypothetical protein
MNIARWINPKIPIYPKNQKVSLSSTLLSFSKSIIIIPFSIVNIEGIVIELKS